MKDFRPLIFNVTYSALMGLVATGIAALICNACDLPRVWAILAGLGAFALLVVGIALCQVSSMRSQERGEM
jgi:hypothetical protein